MTARTECLIRSFLQSGCVPEAWSEEPQRNQARTPQSLVVVCVENLIQAPGFAGVPWLSLEKVSFQFLSLRHLRRTQITARQDGLTGFSCKNAIASRPAILPNTNARSTDTAFGAVA
jgi:hypothetical protein